MNSKGAIYARVSTEEQAREGYSINAQINTLKSYAKIYNIDIVKVYKDEGLSGKNINRPELQKMLADAEKNQFDIVLVWKISRLSRNLKNLLSIVDMLDSKNISFISQSETFNTSTPVGRMTLQILGSIAEFERNTIIENIKLGLQEKAKKGEWLGGRVFGYKNENKRLVINENQAMLVRKIFDLFGKGKSVGEINKTANNEGYKTVNNKSFSKGAILRILKNPIYAGLIRHNNNKKNQPFIVKGIYEPIITFEQFEKTQERLSIKKDRIIKSTKTFLLSRLLKCPHCCKSMVGYRSSKYNYYRCSTYHNYGKEKCRGLLINADKVESEILYIIKNLLGDSNFKKKIYDEAGVTQLFSSRIGEELFNIDDNTKVILVKSIIKEITLTFDKKIGNIKFNIS